MSKSITFYATYALFLTLSLALGNVSAQEESAVIERDAINLTIPNPFGDIPLFETNNQNGRLIGIHLPFIFDMIMHFRGDLSNTLIDTSFMKGLMSFTYDRMPNIEGQNSGPIKFGLLWMNLYDNQK